MAPKTTMAPRRAPAPSRRPMAEMLSANGRPSRGSTVTSEMGLVALEIDGKGSEVAKAIGWLKAKGITVEPIEKNVIE